MPFPDVTRHVHPVLPARALGRRTPVRVELAGRAYALFRDAEGRPAALDDACPHRKAPLSLGRVRPDGRLQCAYHGWHFGADGQGVCPSQPSLAKCDATAMSVVEHLGWLWLTARDASPEARLPALGWPDEGWVFAGAFAQRAAAPLHVVFDNFSEDEHTPFVHGRLGWSEEDARAIDFTSSAHDDRTEVRYAAPQRASRLLPLLLLRSGDTFENAWVTRFSPVHTVYTLSWTSPTGQPRPAAMRAAIFFVPETERATQIVTFAWSRLADARYRRLMPLVRAAALALAWKEVHDDVRFVRHVADTPFDLAGMRLDKYDAPLVHNHRLLRRIYFGVGSSESET